MILLEKNYVVDYKLADDTSENPVIFKLRKLDSVKETLLFDKVRNEKLSNTEGAFLYTQQSIIGIENLKDADGVVGFETEKDKDYISRELLGRIPSVVLSELSYECAVIGGLIPAEKKS